MQVSGFSQQNLRKAHLILTFSCVSAGKESACSVGDLGSEGPLEKGTSLNFPGSSDSKASAYNAGDPGSIPGLERSPGEGIWQPTLVFLPGEYHVRGAW